MKKLGLMALAASLALAACGRDDSDQLNEPAVDNQAELNALAANAAADANAEMEALGNQEQQLEAENTAAAEAPETPANATDPSQVEEDVQGM